MSAVREWFEDTFDSPSFPRDLQSLVLPGRVGLWFLVLNACHCTILGFSVAFALFENSPTMQSEVVESIGGLGQLMTMYLMSSILWICTLLIPIRASGLIEGPRWGKFFDQIVLSGMTPTRYIAGKLLAQNLFFALIVAASLPYAVLALSLGGTQFMYVATCLFCLWIYINMLTLATLASAAFMNDYFAAAQIIVGWIILNASANSRILYVFGLLSPVGVISWPFWENVEMYGSMPVQLLEIGDWTFGPFMLYLMGSGVCLVSSLVCVLLGPITGIVQANSTFGEVVMPGDNKRKRAARMRYTQRRQNEVCFYYENRSPWLTEWEAPLRFGGMLLALIGATGYTMLVIYTMGARQIPPEAFHWINMILFTVGFIAGGILFSTTKNTDGKLLRAGTKRHRVSTLCTLYFAIFMGWLLFLCVLIPWVIEPGLGDWLGAGASRYRSADLGSVELGQAAYIFWTWPLLLILGLEFYGLLRLISMGVWARSGAVVSTLLLLLLYWTIPNLTALLIYQLLENDPQWLAPLAMLDCISPWTWFIAGTDRPGSGFADFIGVGAYHATPYIHLLIAFLYFVTCNWRSRKLRDIQVGQAPLEELQALVARNAPPLPAAEVIGAALTDPESGTEPSDAINAELDDTESSAEETP